MGEIKVEAGGKTDVFTIEFTPNLFLGGGVSKTSSEIESLYLIGSPQDFDAASEYMLLVFLLVDVMEPISGQLKVEQTQTILKLLEDAPKTGKTVSGNSNGLDMTVTGLKDFGSMVFTISPK